MSYILDALKRSEQERHQGQMPTLTGSDSLLLLNQRRSQRWPYILIGVLLLNAVIYAFFQWRSTANPTPAIAEVAQDNPSKVDVQDVSSPATVVHVANPEPSQALRNPVVKEVHKAIISKNKTETDESGAVYIDGGLLIQPSQSRASLPTIPDDSLPIEFESPEPVSSEKSEPLSAYNDVLQLVEMDQQFQRKIPVLKFNSHIYSDAPSSRRVIINNNYLREGQLFSGLEVIEIGESNLVLGRDGVLFKIPVLQDWNGL